jgi:hypothetical protein
MSCGWPRNACQSKLRSLGVFSHYVVFDGHVFEFTRIKDVAAFEALDEFYIFFTCDDAYAWMPTDFCHIGYFEGLLRGWYSADCSHFRIQASNLTGALSRIGDFMQEFPLVKRFSASRGGRGDRRIGQWMRITKSGLQIFMGKG